MEALRVHEVMRPNTDAATRKLDSDILKSPEWYHMRPIMTCVKMSASAAANEAF